MCGINGIMFKDSCKDIDERIKNMNDALLHRGPDAGGVFITSDKCMALGHRRLSIIDIDERSTQPMCSTSGRWVIIYNGEIYNYKELKMKTHQSYKTTSDTEVVLAYIEEWGIEKFLLNCNGMFAFAAYDRYQRKMYLCRDRLGIKPLLYYLDEGKLVFSSEAKGILRSGLVKAELDEASVDDYLGYRYVREPYTFFEGIRQLEAGTYLCVDPRLQVRSYVYWRIPEEFCQDPVYDEDLIKEEFEERLKQAVLKRTIADVPLGTYLSGGVDSSILTAIVSGQQKEILNTYTIGFPELNEFSYSDMVSVRYRTNHHKILMTDRDYLSTMEGVIDIKGAPLGVPNEIPLAIMSRELKKDITVVLSGEGADELLGGYGRIFRSPFTYESQDFNIDFYEYFINLYEYVPRMIRDRFLKIKGHRRKFYDTREREQFKYSSNEYSVFRFFHQYHVKGLLQRVDATTMLASVEARVPFLDHELVEYSYRSVPYEMKLRWKSEAAKIRARGLSAIDFSEIEDIPKYILRKIAFDYLPVEIITRKKMGFPVPLDKWNDRLLPMVENELRETDWLRYSDPQGLIAECRRFERGDQLLWMFLNIQLFLKRYFYKEWRY